MGQLGALPVADLLDAVFTLFFSKNLRGIFCFVFVGVGE